MEAITHNAGQLLTAQPEDHPNVPNGAAPGFVASAYVEWGGWGVPLFLFGVGWLYAFVWRKSLVEGGIWTVLYCILLSMAAYFVAQSFYAIFYRLLLMGIPVVLVWGFFRPYALPDLDMLNRMSPSTSVQANAFRE